MHPYHHALSPQRTYGGDTIDYLPLHNWFDASKSVLVHFTHRALRHHRQGVDQAIRLLGTTITNADNQHVSVEALGLQHLAEDMSRIPTAGDWLRHLDLSGAALPLPPLEAVPSPETLAISSARRFATTPEIVLPLHAWFLETAAWFDDPRHLAMRHHSFAIFEAEQRFGITLYQDHRAIPTRLVAEWHVRAVLGRIPAAADFLRRIKGQPWMAAAQTPDRLGL